jgi:hypothetical protein
MRRSLPFLLTLLIVAALPTSARAFCGFYVAQADTKIFNEASKVVLVRDGDNTVLTMVNDFKGAVKEFAVVIPVPTIIQKDKIRVSDMSVVDHLDAYTAPRLVEYHDEDPCRLPPPMTMQPSIGGRPRSAPSGGADRARSLGVTIEASYTVGEYDILILSATQSDGLETWLKENKYKIPDGASEVLGSYIKQKMKFFIAKVNLQEHDAAGGGNLRPLQVEFTSPKFMLPIRLGTVNANGPQDLFIFALTKTGRVETTNYRTVRLPSDLDLPPTTKAVFADFYKDMFSRQVSAHDMRAVFLEYAWDMSWCDPCAADPLSQQELQKLGVSWAKRAGRGEWDSAQNVFVTRLHVRYDSARFPEDLVFQATSDRSNFQGRYIMRHPFEGEMRCEAGSRYKEQLLNRQRAEAARLVELTGWQLDEQHNKIPGRHGESPPPAPGEEPAAKSDAPKESDEPAPVQEKRWYQFWK